MRRDFRHTAFCPSRPDRRCLRCRRCGRMNPLARLNPDLAPDRCVQFVERSLHKCAKRLRQRPRAFRQARSSGSERKICHKRIPLKRFSAIRPSVAMVQRSRMLPLAHSLRIVPCVRQGWMREPGTDVRDKPHGPADAVRKAGDGETNSPSVHHGRIEAHSPGRTRAFRRHPRLSQRFGV